MGYETLKMTDYLAFYAAVLSTVVFVWNFVRASPRYRVSICPGVEEYDGKIQVGLHISIQNPSSHTVHLANVSLLYHHSKKSLAKTIRHAVKYRSYSKSIGWVHTALSNYDIKDCCPLALAAGSSHNIFVPKETLEHVLNGSVSRDIRVVAQDQLWRDKYSNVLCID